MDHMKPSAIEIAMSYDDHDRSDEAAYALGDAVCAAATSGLADMLRVAVLAAAREEEGDAVELAARAVAIVWGVSRGDRPALALIEAAPTEVKREILALPHIATAMKTVKGWETSPIPPELGFRTHIALSPEGWAKFAALAGLPGHGAVDCADE